MTPFVSLYLRYIGRLIVCGLAAVRFSTSIWGDCGAGDAKGHLFSP